MLWPLDHCIITIISDHWEQLPRVYRDKEMLKLRSSLLKSFKRIKEERDFVRVIKKLLNFISVDQLTKSCIISWGSLNRYVEGQYIFHFSFLNEVDFVILYLIRYRTNSMNQWPFALVVLRDNLFLLSHLSSLYCVRLMTKLICRKVEFSDINL